MAKETYTVTFLNGDTQDVILPFALLNLIAGHVGDIANITLLTTDPALRSDIVRQVLSERDHKGKITEGYSEFAKPISIEEATNLLLWVQENLYDFFTKTLKANQAMLERVKKQMTEAA